MTKTDNRSTGNRFEQVVAEKLAEDGFWAHVMQQNKSGQPADIVAIKGRFHTLIDGKVVSDSNGFSFDRIEENQRLAMRMFTRRCGELCYFAIGLSDESIWMISLSRIETLESRGKKKLTDKEIRGVQAWSLEDWLIASNDWGKDI